MYFKYLFFERSKNCLLIERVGLHACCLNLNRNYHLLLKRESSLKCFDMSNQYKRIYPFLIIHFIRSWLCGYISLNKTYLLNINSNEIVLFSVDYLALILDELSRCLIFEISFHKIVQLLMFAPL